MDFTWGKWIAIVHIPKMPRHFLNVLECKSHFVLLFEIYCSVAHLSPLFLRSGCLKAMESTEKSQVRKTFSARSRKARMLSATSTEIPPSGKAITCIYSYLLRALSDKD